MVARSVILFIQLKLISVRHLNRNKVYINVTEFEIHGAPTPCQVEILCVQEVVTHFYIVSYYIKLLLGHIVPCSLYKCMSVHNSAWNSSLCWLLFPFFLWVHWKSSFEIDLQQQTYPYFYYIGRGGYLIIQLIFIFNFHMQNSWQENFCMIK